MRHRKLDAPYRFVRQAVAARPRCVFRGYQFVMMFIAGVIAPSSDSPPQRNLVLPLCPVSRSVSKLYAWTVCGVNTGCTISRPGRGYVDGRSTQQSASQID